MVLPDGFDGDNTSEVSGSKPGPDVGKLVVAY